MKLFVQQRGKMMERKSNKHRTSPSGTNMNQFNSLSVLELSCRPSMRLSDRKVL